MASAPVCARAPAEPSSDVGAPRAARSSAPERPGRLRSSSEIRRVLRDGTTRRSGRVILYVAPGRGPARAAWVSGKRVGGAVARNRARRLLREAWRALAPRVRADRDIVLVARGPFGAARAAELIEEIETLLAQADLMRDPR